MAGWRLPRWHITGVSGDLAKDELDSRGQVFDRELVARLATLLRAEAQPTTDISGLRLDPPSPGMKSKFLPVVLGIAGIVIAMAGLRAVADIVTPVFLALNFVIVAFPVQAWLVRHHVPRALAATLVCVGILTGLAAFFWSLGWALALLIEKLPDYQPQYVELYNVLLRNLDKGGISEEQLLNSMKKVDPNQLADFAATVLAGLQGTVTLVGLTVTAVLFILMDTVGIERRIRVATEHHSALLTALDSFTVGVRKYWMVSTVFGLIIAVLDVGALWIIGVPLALVWGLLSFVTNYIPNIGFVIGLVPPMLLALLDGGVWKALIVCIAYWVLNFVVQSLIQPKVAGDAIGVTATVSFVSLLFWGYVLGLAGALVALPATLLVKAILVDGDPAARWVNVLIASDPRTAVPDALGGQVPTDEEDPTDGDRVDDVVDEELPHTVDAPGEYDDGADRLPPARA